jgi:hypothetical protein
MTVYNDAVKLETEDCGRRRMIGWFRDEVSAIGAVTEHALMGSAILPDLRKLPLLTVHTSYIQEWIKRPLINFKRATRIKYGPYGRRVVRVPGTFGKVWI